MAIEESKYIETNEQYNEGIAIDEYNGNISLSCVTRGKDGNLYLKWSYPSERVSGKSVPAEKMFPVKVFLGDSTENAISTLRQVLILLGDCEKQPDYSSQNGKDIMPPPDDDIPF